MIAKNEGGYPPNRLITARRAFQRLLQEEIRSYAGSEDEVAEEIRDLFRFLGES